MRACGCACACNVAQSYAECPISRTLQMLHRSHCSAACRVVPLPSRRPHARGRGLQVRNTTKRLCTSPVWARPEVPCLCSLHLQPVCAAHAPVAPGSRITGSCLSLQCRSDLRLDVQVNPIAHVQFRRQLKHTPCPFCRFSCLSPHTPHDHPSSPAPSPSAYSRLGKPSDAAPIFPRFRLRV